VPTKTLPELIRHFETCGEIKSGTALKPLPTDEAVAPEAMVAE
jgi:hypothetical protein